MNVNRPEVLLFDVGGVLVELGPPPLKPEWMGGRQIEDVWRDWISMPAGRDFERGRTTPAEFADQIIRGLCLDVSPTDFLASFTAWPKAPYPGTLDWLESLKSSIRVALLSNTNCLHAVRMRAEMRLLDVVDVALFSHEIGLVKPDADCFNAATERLDVLPSRIAFFDDNAGNVEAARKFGMQAFETAGPHAVRAAVKAVVA